MQLTEIYPWGQNASQICRALDDEKLLCEVFSGPDRYPMRAAFLTVAGDLKIANTLPPTIFIPSKLADDQLAGPFLVQMLSNPDARNHMAASRRLWKSIVGIDAPFPEVLGDTLQRWFDDPSYAHSAPAWSNCLTRAPKQDRHIQFNHKAFDNLIKSVDNPLKRTSYHRFMVLIATFAIVEPEHSIWIVSKILHKFPKVATWVAPYGASEAQINGLVKQASSLIQPPEITSSPRSTSAPAAAESPAASTNAQIPQTQAPASQDNQNSVQLKKRLAEWTTQAQETAKLLTRSSESLLKFHSPTGNDTLIRSLTQVQANAWALIADARTLAVKLSLPEPVSPHPIDLEPLILAIEQREFEQNVIHQKLQQVKTLLARISSLTAAEPDAKALAPLLAQAAQASKELKTPDSLADTADLDKLLAPSHPFTCVLALLDHDAGAPDSQLDETHLDSCDTLVISTYGVSFQRKLHQGKFTFAPTQDASPSPQPTPTKPTPRATQLA
jgi:hypothetical protein